MSKEHMFASLWITIKLLSKRKRGQEKIIKLHFLCVDSEVNKQLAEYLANLALKGVMYSAVYLEVNSQNSK